ncbi:MAG TPA: lipocalin-like domain-containing protein [Candidatus Eisenbacteria bacterium]
MFARVPALAFATSAPGFTPVLEPRTWSFPRDHGSHPGFQTEWWYWTGHLEARGHRYGYEVVFFRRVPPRPTDLGPGYEGWQAAEIHPAHVALTDIDGKSFHHEQRLFRTIGGIAAADTARLDVRCGDWTARQEGESFVVSAGMDDWHLDLTMTSTKPPALHGREGISTKGPVAGQASYYYSLTRLETRGTLTRGDRTEPVTGLSWMDHEFFSSDLDTTLAGWDWFSLQLDDGTELMLYRLRGRPGTDRDWLSGSFIDRAGAVQPLRREAITIVPQRTWTSPTTGAVYPLGWQVTIAPLGFTLSLSPDRDDQELDTRGSTGVVYWEGSVSVTGTREGKVLTGVGYAELTGYDGRTPMRGATP